MARPQNVREVEERYENIASFDCDKFLAFPSILKTYTAFIEAVQRMSGRVDNTYGGRVNVDIPKTPKQLQDRLEADQRSWDMNRDNYNAAIAGEVLANYKRHSVTAWAEREGMPVPVYVEQTDTDN